MYGKLFLIASLVFLFFLPEPIWNLQVTEIMYNPSGSDTNREWIEIYNNDNEAYNMTGWKLRTDDTDHSLKGYLIIMPGEYDAIVQNNISFLIDYPNFTGNIIDSSWSSLTNSEAKSIVLKNSTDVLYNVTYPIVNEGKTACLIDYFQECEPTPGEANRKIELINETTETNITEETNTTNQANITEQVNAVRQNVTSTKCDVSLTILSDQIFDVGRPIEYEISLNDKDCYQNKSIEIEYWIEDLFGNYVREKLITAQSFLCSRKVDRQWSPKDVVGSESYKIVARISSISCEDSNTSDNRDEKLIIVRGAATNKSGMKIKEEKADMKIKSRNDSAIISTNCKACDILIVGPGTDKTVKNSYKIENSSGTFYVFLLNGSEIINRSVVNLELVKDKKEGGIIVTPKKNKTEAKYIILLHLFRKLRVF